MPKPIEIIFLGTGSSVPTLKRAHPAILFHREKDYFLFDCGESAQLGLEKAKISPMKISKIFITHWHADHFAGLLPLLETLHLSNREKPLEIFGPEASRFMDALIELSYWGIGFPVKAIDVSTEEIREILETPEYKIKSVPVQHNVPAVGYIFEEKSHWNIDMKKAKKYGLAGPILDKIKTNEKIKFKNKTIKISDIAKITKGRKISYSGDTMIHRPFFSESKEADLLIHDGTFVEHMETKSHPSVADVAKLAKKHNIKKLILTHFSRRYRSSKEISAAVKPIFKNSIVAEDGLKVVV